MLAEVSQITPDGLPVLLIEDAPPKINTPSLKLTRPEIYYGEVTHEPVFVNTAQKEFNYPSGERQRAFHATKARAASPSPRSSCALAAAISEGEPNILLTDYLTANSRMMIRRKVRDRLQELAGFLALGHRPVPGDHRCRPAGVDGGWLHHLRRASLFARRRRARTWAA